LLINARDVIGEYKILVEVVQFKSRIFL